MRRTSRRVVLAVAVVLGLGTLGMASGSAAGATTAAAPCGTADLSAQLKAGSPGAGQRYATVVLTDMSTHACTIGGYGGLGLLGSPRQGTPWAFRKMQGLGSSRNS